MADNFDALRARAESLLFGSQDEMRKIDLLDKMKQNTRMPWLPVKGFDSLALEAFQRGFWEDLGNGYYTKAPKPKTTEVIITEDGAPDDEGKVRLKVDSVNAGSTPKIYYEQDGDVSESSPQLKENILVTQALRVQFLAVDPTGKNQTGDPTTWTNRLVIRNKFNPTSRTLELFVAPKGTIRYTLDGSEPRNGTDYTDPIQLVNEEIKVYVFAECDGLDVKKEFTLPGADNKDLPIKSDVPATLHSPSPKRLDNSTKAYKGLKTAKEKDIFFEQVTLQVGSAPKAAFLTLGEMKLSAEFIEKELNHLQSLLSPEAPVVFSFKKAHFSSGFDLEQFAKTLEIEIQPGEVEQ